ncbi:unnamed protein product [Allacma fusca]|uniref:Uncharacterized protein n=1 Tax=Allacma fusca TaxID=39272 RepID=A0A8J2PTW8_9HEXA|nr:unnamed protein product [Allacma fusca]
MVESIKSATVDLDDLCDGLDSQMTMNEPLLKINRFAGLEKYNFHINWISNADKLTKRMVQTIINVLNDKVNEDTHDGLSTLKYLGIESVCFRTSLAFLHALLDKHIDAQFHLIAATSDINNLQEHNFVDEEYIVGLRLDSFETLSVKSQVGVLAAQHYFDGQLRRGHAMQIGFLKNVIQLDPDHYLWHFNLHSQYRFLRREKSDRNRTGPGDEEVKEILKAVELAPDHPLILVGSCVCVAEMMKTHGTDGLWRQPMRYGDKEFKSIQAVVDFIKLQTKKILDFHQETVRINIHIAECFSFLLPHEYRDMEFAKECIQRALQFHPNSSKAHHRMGNFILMTSGNMNEAIQHYSRAITCDSRNFPAKADLMKALMCEAQENSEKILELINTELENPDYNSNRISSIHFLKGCFLLLLDEKNPENEVNAALEWLKACEVSNESLDFKNISYMAKRYKWPKGKLTYRVVSSAIQSLIQSGKVDASNENLIRLEKIAQKNKEEAVQHYQQTRGGSNGGRGGYAARGGRAPFGLQRRRSESLMVAGSSAPGEGVVPTEATRRPRRWSNSNSASVDSGGMRVVVIRQPRPPQGPGFVLSERTASTSESENINN